MEYTDYTLRVIEGIYGSLPAIGELDDRKILAIEEAIRGIVQTERERCAEVAASYLMEGDGCSDRPADQRAQVAMRVADEIRAA